MTIDSTVQNIIKGCSLVIQDNIPGRGYGVNEELSRIPKGIDVDKILYYTSDHEYPSSLPMESIYISSRDVWMSGDDFRKKNGLQMIVGQDDLPIGFAYISHGKVNDSDLYLVSYTLKSKKPDEFGREGIAFRYTLILSKENYQILMETIKKSPRSVHNLFRSIAPQHFDNNKMEDEPVGGVSLFPLWRNAD